MTLCLVRLDDLFDDDHGVAAKGNLSMNDSAWWKLAKSHLRSPRFAALAAGAAADDQEQNHPD